MPFSALKVIIRSTKLCVRWSQGTRLCHTGAPCHAKPQKFNPKKILILTKLTRLEFEKIRHGGMTDSELEKALKKRGSDYSLLLYHHYIHKGCEHRVNKCLQQMGAETKVVNRLECTDDSIDWADMIVTTGGDGTFLMAASRIQDTSKPVIGFNTDPTRSEGHLCLPKEYSVNTQEAVNKIFQGKFKWTYRKRIRVTLIGENVFEKPIELHDQQLKHPEFRFFDCLQEQLRSADSEDLPSSVSLQKRVLPVLALNEVYLGECVSARVSYFEISVNNEEKIKTKNAGMCVATGTGSTSWSYNISKTSMQTVEEMINILEDLGIPTKSKNDPALTARVAYKYNEKLIFHPEKSSMLYCIRDPITSYTLPFAKELVPRGFASRLQIRSRCFDACLVIDGGLSFPFNDGTVAILETHDEDALKTIKDFSDHVDD